MIRSRIAGALTSTFATLLATASGAQAATPSNPKAAAWYEAGAAVVAANQANNPNERRAKNVILFVGDGMGVSTVTAARILEGQLRGKSGEENALAFERLPYVALSKTYSANQQTSDSAPTATAMVAGIKTNDGAISVDEDIERNEASGAVVASHAVQTILEQAEARGLSTGIVTTARVTHATPAVNYAHIGNRDWESNGSLPAGATVKDIAAQLVDAQRKYGIEVVLGGGRTQFYPNTQADPEYPSRTGGRTDGRKLYEEWTAARPNSAFVWNQAQFDAIDPARTRHLLGLFERSHVQYEEDRQPLNGAPSRDGAGEPSLAEMTGKAIEILQNNRAGFYLMVEAGRIDHAHHAGNAYRALTDTIALSDAVQTAMSMTDPKDTLIVVTADHSHVFTIAGYPKRGNPILGFVTEPGRSGPTPALDGLPYTTVSYANGLGFANLAVGGDTRYSSPFRTGRFLDLSMGSTVLSQGFHQEALVPLPAETHAGEDVAIYAGGPKAHLFQGTMEQNTIYHVMKAALGL
jgi:alkaline phosphatase